LSGAGDGRKKKGKSVDAPKPTTDDSTSTSPPSPGFIAKEYAALKEAGIDEEEEITNIINMRWKKMQALKMDSAAPDEGDVDVEEEEAEQPSFIKIPLKLTSEQAATSNYIFVSGPDDENNYLYKKAAPEEAAVKPAAKAVAKPAAMSKAAAPKVAPKAAAHGPAAPAAGKPAKTFTSPSKKRKEPEPEPEPEPFSAADVAFQQAAIQFCMKQMKSRVMAKIKAKRLRKENLFDFILAFDAGTKGTTDDVVDTFIEQSLCETDNEEDEE
jgi:hypothetical protein